MNAPVLYVPNLLDGVTSDRYFKSLWNNLNWIQHDKVPRKEYYVNDHNVPYSYGIAPYARVYYSQPTTPEIVDIRRLVEANLWCLTGNLYDMDVCFLNGYKDGFDQLGWHSDNSPEMDDKRPIITVSLGAEREIWFRENPSENKNCPICNGTGWHKLGYALCKICGGNGRREPPDIKKLKLGNGSMAVMMPHMQDTHQHRIPKCSWVCGSRISLTFRGYIKG